MPESKFKYSNGDVRDVATHHFKAMTVKRQKTNVILKYYQHLPYLWNLPKLIQNAIFKVPTKRYLLYY